MFTSLERLTVAELSARIGRKKLSPVEVLEHFLSRYERLNRHVNAIVTVDSQGALGAARAAEQRALAGQRLSPLDGIPVVIKDNIFVRDWTVTWGSRLYRAFRVQRDDLGIERLRSAGAVLMGATNTPEFALNQYTDNLVYGVTRNPWAPELTPGGSSGGAVAALALGLTPLAVGTDAGGSIRRPASYAGVVGLRPSTGRIPRAYGFPALAHDFQVVAPAARTARDAYLLLQIMAGPDVRDRLSAAFSALPRDLREVRLPRLRIRCLPLAGNAPIDPDVRLSVERAARTLSALGHSVEEGPAPYSPARIDALWSTLSSAGLARVLEKHEDWRELVSPSSKLTAERGASVDACTYVAALDEIAALRLEFAEVFDAADVLLTPTSNALPWSVERAYPETIGGREVGPRGAATFATFVNATGLPAVSVPGSPAANGLPVGVQFVGRYGDDATLMALAAEYEEAAPWAERWPAMAGA